jgi:hypothetical protein
LPPASSPRPASCEPSMASTIFAGKMLIGNLLFAMPYSRHEYY